MTKNELFEKWINSLDIQLMDWQKEVLRVACTQPNKKLYISMPRCYGRHMVLKLIEQYEQMIKGEKKMQKKLDKFDMKDIHSGYVVKFRKDFYGLCMRADSDFKKIFIAAPSISHMLPSIENGTFIYAKNYNGSRYYHSIDGVENPDFDIVAVYGLVEGEKNYSYISTIGVDHRPLLWEETAVKMTLEEIEKKLGHKVEIIEPKKVGIKGKDCERCVHELGNSKCAPIGLFCDDCKDCKRSLGLTNCPCNSKFAKDGEPCPYFEEEKK